jgi:UDP-N-acetylglucosamine enolpyruvyl transferase
MQKCIGTPQNSLLLESDNSVDLKTIISKHKDKFISFLHKLGLHVEHKEKNINYQNSSTTILTLKTTCFKVDFNDNFVKISPLK